MTKLRTGCATPFELILRFHTRGESDFAVTGTTNPVFLYAESARLVGAASRAQKAYLYEMLCALNRAQGHCVDVPLRALRCKNFVDAGVGQIVKKKHKARGVLDAFENTFG